MKNQYVMSVKQIEQLAAERTQSGLVLSNLDSTYLRVLVTAVQAELGAKRGRVPTIEAQIACLDTVAAPYYDAVLRGVVTSEIAVDASMEASESTRRVRERNRRAIFARTAKSTIMAYAKAGGDIRALDVQTVTKGWLQAYVSKARTDAAPTTDKVGRALQSILDAVARESTDAARAHLEGVIEALNGALESLPESNESALAATIAAMEKASRKRIAVA